MSRAVLLAVGCASVVVLVIGRAPAAGRPLVIWNATASAPEGLYRVSPARRLNVGDWLAVRPPAALGVWLSARGYLPSGALLIKQVAALPPAQVCRSNGLITANGRLVAHAASTDRWGRALPGWGGCRPLRASEVFLVNSAPGSLDSRYLGPFPRASIVGRVSPLWTLKAHADARS